MSGRVVIEVENLSKFYRLGLIGGGTLRDDLARWWARSRGLPDPLLKIGEQEHGNREGENLWALRDISFNVREGEVLGVIGRNGAGKSTLLKILSRITAPTSGRAIIRGRVGSLLEVGTGFHPELTGLENIYLNGAILGMKRGEITRKLEEIIEFAEMARFIDTPVKRYSSGMTVRLAFAVAAHLEPEILIVDEVLAVGDAAFQDRCLSKMGKDALSGRTIIFVSHNIAAMRRLCTHAILLAKGSTQMAGSANEVCDAYAKRATESRRRTLDDFGQSAITEHGRLLEVMATRLDGNSNAIDVESGFSVSCCYESFRESDNIHFSLNVYTVDGTHVLNSFPVREEDGLAATVNKGIYVFKCLFPSFLLNAGRYRLDLHIVRRQNQVLCYIESALDIEVADIPTGLAWDGKWLGIVRPSLTWTYSADS